MFILLSLLFVAGCGENQASRAQVFQLRDVVVPKLAELEAGLPASPQIAAPASADLRDEVLGMLESLASPRSAMRDTVLADVRSRKQDLVPLLTEVLNDTTRSDEVRAAAIELLAVLDKPASIEPLLLALQLSREPWIRAQCAWRLIGTSHDQFLPRILLRLRYESDEVTVAWLADCAARFGNYAGVDGLCVVRNRARTPELVALAEEHLATLAAALGVSDGDTLNARWFSGELEQSLAPRPVSKALEREVWKCIQALGEWDLRVVDDRRFILTDMNLWVVGALAQTLHEKNVYLRIHAAQCLARMGPRAQAAAPELLSALTDARLAPAAAAALAALRWTAASEALEQALLHSKDLDFSTAAARALGELAQARSIAPLRQAFAPEQAADLRQAAAEALLAIDSGNDVIQFLALRMTAPRAEAISAENALTRFLAARAKDEAERFDPLLSDWRALDLLPPEMIATKEQVATRLAARAELLKSRLLAAPR